PLLEVPRDGDQHQAELPLPGVGGAAEGPPGGAVAVCNDDLEAGSLRLLQHVLDERQEEPLADAGTTPVELPRRRGDVRVIHSLQGGAVRLEADPVRPQEEGWEDDPAEATRGALEEAGGDEGVAAERVLLAMPFERPQRQIPHRALRQP